MSNFKFDPIEHKYTLDGIKILSVNDILAEQGYISQYRDDKIIKAMQKGTLLHKYMESLITGEYFKSDLHKKEQIQIKKMVAQMFFGKDIIAEHSLLYDKDGITFAGTPDAILIADNHACIYDLKTGAYKSISDVYRLQLAGYAILVSNKYNIPIENIHGKLMYVGSKDYIVKDVTDKMLRKVDEYMVILRKQFLGTDPIGDEIQDDIFKLKQIKDKKDNLLKEETFVRDKIASKVGKYNYRNTWYNIIYTEASAKEHIELDEEKFINKLKSIVDEATIEKLYNECIKKKIKPRKESYRINFSENN